MRGQIRPRGEGAWAVILYLGRGADGKERRKWVTVRGTKKDAQRELTRLLREIDTGVFVEPSKLTLAQYLDRWLEDAAKAKVTPKTLQEYRNKIRSQIKPALGHLPLAKLSPMDVQGFYTKSRERGRLDGTGGLSTQTILHMHRILHEAMEQAVKWQLLARNPCDAVEPPRPERRPMKALDEAGTAKLLQVAAGTRLYVPILLAIGTGMRRGEILGLRWQDVDVKTGTATVQQSLEQTTGNLRFKPPKTAKGRREIPLPSYVVDALVRHRGQQAEQRLLLGPAYRDQGLVFARPDGTPIAPDRFSQDFADLVRKNGLPRVRLHDLRHSHATQLLKQGTHPKIVSERLGHANIGITLDTYSHVLPGLQEEATRRFDQALRRALGEEG